MRQFQLVLIVSVMAAAGSGCARTMAQAPAMPELTPPPPPPRVVAIYVEEPVPTVEPGPAETALATPPPRPSPRPPATRPEPARSEPEPARSEPERPSTAAPALTMKPVAGMEAKTAASIRNLLAAARGNLQRVNYAALNADGRAQYDTARRFLQQADDALKSGNLVFAGKLADKAATMAAVLVR